MTEPLLTSPEAEKWAPWVKTLFAPGNDSPPERVAEFTLELCSGRADALSGRFLHLADDLDALIRNAGRIQKEDLYTLRLNKLAV